MVGYGMGGGVGNGWWSMEWVVAGGVLNGWWGLE